MPDVACCRRGEYVKIAGAEDEGVQDLCDEGDTCAHARQPKLQLAATSRREGGQRTLGAAVGVDSPYQDEFGGRVRHVA